MARLISDYNHDWTMQHPSFQSLYQPIEEYLTFTVGERPEGSKPMTAAKLRKLISSWQTDSCACGNPLFPFPLHFAVLLSDAQMASFYGNVPA